MRVVRYFVWIVFLVAGLAAWKVYGLPHFIWSYEFIDNGEQYNPFAERYYLTCSFIGPYGEFTVDASNGRCGWVHLFKERV